MLQLRNVKRKFRPRLETLEDRTLLSVCTVDRLTDNNSGGGGEGSDLAGDLRYCLTNVGDGDDISFGKGVTGTINLAGALPDLTHSINIEGPGAGSLTVRRDTGGNYRIFTVGDGTTVIISGLTIANGLVMEAGGRGGGIFISNATVTVANCILTGNTARSTNNVAEGGGIYGAATLINSTISNNIAVANNAAGWGGGLYGNFTIVDSTISGNTAREGLGPGDGGGIYGAATVINSTISGNYASFGGGIWGSAEVINSTISGNTANKGGGGIAGGGTLFNSTVSRNSGSYAGGGILIDRTLTVSNSTISENSAGEGGGGGILNSGNLTVSNSTISGNSAGRFGYGGGGGIYNNGKTLTVSSTIAGNSAPRGGGIFNDRGTMAARNTIVGANTGPGGPDVYVDLGSQGHNLVSDTQGGSGYDTETDLLDVDPRLGPLAANGGPTLTHALLPDSPAIDAGDNTDAPDWDQRGKGFPRIVNDIIDIGAFEYQGDGGAPALYGHFVELSSAQLVGLIPKIPEGTVALNNFNVSKTNSTPLQPVPEVPIENGCSSETGKIAYRGGHEKGSVLMPLDWWGELINAINAINATAGISSPCTGGDTHEHGLTI